MHIEGSCHCGRVRFSLECKEPVPYQRCYCSICVKTAGGGGYCINLGGEAATLKVRGEQFLKQYRAMVERKGERVTSKHHRYFCRECGSHLWAQHENWPDLVHPVAGVIDTPLPVPMQHVHIMTASRRAWVQVEGQPDDAQFEQYPNQGLRAWHEAHGYPEP
jgi:hypothetical protein